MLLIPFVFKKYSSTLDIKTIQQNLTTNTIVTRTSPGGDMIMKRQAFDIQFDENKFVLIRSATGEKRGLIGLVPIAHGNLSVEGNSITLNVSLRPVYAEIIALIVLFAVQVFCAYYSIANGYYIVAVFSLLFIILAYLLVIAKFGAECKNYLTMIQKCI